MISEQMKEQRYREYLLAGYQKRERQKRRADAIRHYEEITGADHGKRSKVFELEQTEEGYTRIRKVRL